MPIAQSAHVQSYEYNPDASVLTVSFTNGAIYEYQGVTQSDADHFAAAGSKGSHLHSTIIPKFGKGSRLLPPMSRTGR